MIVIIAGTREPWMKGSGALAEVADVFFHINCQASLAEAEHGKIQKVLSGGAKFVDTIGEAWAASRLTPVRHFRPNIRPGWRTPAQSYVDRNEAMACYAHGLILVWDGLSSGSADMRRRAKAKGLAIYEVIL